jgi:hypothetical protein
MDEREAAIRSTAEHVERTRKRIEEGQVEIKRQQATISSLYQRSVDREASDYDDAA